MIAGSFECGDPKRALSFRCVCMTKTHLWDSSSKSPLCECLSVCVCFHKALWTWCEQ